MNQCVIFYYVHYVYYVYIMYIMYVCMSKPPSLFVCLFVVVVVVVFLMPEFVCFV